MPFLAGKRVIVQDPIRTYNYKIVTIKVKQRFKSNRSTQRIKYFSGWADLVPNGQVVYTNNTIIMNAKTWADAQRIPGTNYDERY